MMSPSFSNRRDSNERGAVLLTFAVVILSMLTLTGLALDAGNLYAAKVGAQAAADAGSLAGASLIVTNFPVDDAERSAREVATLNLDLKGVPASDVQSEYADNQMAVTIRADVELFLLSKLPSVGIPFTSVVASSITEIDPATVSIILDTSESMACPVDDESGTMPACDCAPDCPQNDTSRIFALKQALLGDGTPHNPGFLSMFNPSRDSVNLVAFGTGAQLMQGMQKNTFNRALMRSTIASLRAQGGTNLCDAFLRSYMDVRQATERHDEAAYVVFTDGAPTAARFLFTQGVRENQVIPGADWAKYDYLSWGVVLNGNSVPQVMFETPPYKDKGNNKYWNPRVLASVEPRRPPAWTITPPPTIPLSENGTAVSTLDVSQPWQPFSSTVLGGMTITRPYGGDPIQLGFPARFSGGVYTWTDWGPSEHLQLYADCALALSDVMRDEGGTFYGIGYGVSATQSGDPYQMSGDPGHTRKRKDYLMNRVTVDPCGILGPNPPFPGITPYAELADGGVSTGSYYPTARINDLQDIFLRIARKIQLRLIK